LKSHFVEVSRLERGVRTETRVLSWSRERQAVRRVALVVGSLFAATLTAVVVAMHALDRVVFAPHLIMVLTVVWAAIGSKALRAARSRAQRVALGPEMSADGFAPVRVDLVRRAGAAADVFELGVVHGMSGEILSGRISQPVEALAPPAGVSAIYRRLEEGDSALLNLGAETYLVRRVDGDEAEPVPATGARPWRLAAAFVPRRLVMAGLVASGMAGVWASVKDGGAVTALKPPVAATHRAAGWEAELQLRLEAQLQAASLHQCFDRLPLACQKPGFVGVGLSLTKEGEIRSHWIASSTYTESCPVTACMGDLVALWQFNPLPEPMRVVLPVQVLRTGKQLPLASHPVAAAAAPASKLLASTP